MSEDINVEADVFEEENPIIHLEMEDGVQLDCAVICIFGIEEQDYIALVPVKDLETDEEESELLLYRYEELPDDEVQLDNIEDDEEYEMVSAAFDAILDDEDDEEE